ncbi:phage tail protein [Streptomyces sp. NPDC050658]|uniref:phage tail protein n=1 Tax=unclassified Streptomyces TaxID=2593676 RepID=UPI00343C6D86
MPSPQDDFVVHTFAIQIDGIQLEQLKGVSGLGIRQRVIESEENDASTGKQIIRKQQGPREAGSIEITRGVDKSTALTDWIRLTAENNDIVKARKNVTIEVKSGKGETVRRYNLANAWASQYQLGALTSGSSEPLMETVTIEYEDLTIA